jgi:hypothetical protein
MSMRERLGSIFSARAFTVFATLVLIVGVVAFATVKLGGDGESAPQAATDEPPIEDFNPATTEAVPAPVPAEARQAAGEFILAAAGREDLKKAWELSHPELRKQCGCTYKQWLTGNIPVQYYPTGNLEGATFGVDESTKRRVVLEVLLSPKPGEEIEPQPFFIGLKAVGQGAKLKWLVDYWAPIVGIPVPQTPGG